MVVRLETELSTARPILAQSTSLLRSSSYVAGSDGTPPGATRISRVTSRPLITGTTKRSILRLMVSISLSRGRQWGEAQLQRVKRFSASTSAPALARAKSRSTAMQKDHGLADAMRTRLGTGQAARLRAMIHMLDERPLSI